MPNNEFALAKALCKEFLPDMDGKALDKLIQTERGATLPLAVDTVLDPEDLKAALETIDESDVAGFESAVNAVAAHKLGSKRCSSNKNGVAKPLLKPIVIDESLTVEKARAFLPPALGCRIEKDTKFHGRWQGFYDRAPPKQRYVGQGLGVSSDVEALRYVLTMLWTFHKEETAEECPFDFKEF